MAIRLASVATYLPITDCSLHVAVCLFREFRILLALLDGPENCYAYTSMIALVR